MVRTGRFAILLTAAALALIGCGGGASENASTNTSAGNASATSAAGASETTSGTAATAGGHQKEQAGAADEGDGLAGSAGGYSLVKVSKPPKAGAQGTMTFVINGPSGKPQTDFVLSESKLLHMYVVRADLTEFQHLHPTLNKTTGQWSVAVKFSKPGPYHAVFDFTALKPDGNTDDRLLGGDFKVGGLYKPVKLALRLGTGLVDGYTVTLDKSATVKAGSLHLTITKNGAAVTDLQPYDEAFAHITGFRQKDLKPVHVHPEQEPKGNQKPPATLTLNQPFTEPGKYRLFIEFQTNGQVHLVPLDVDVT